MVGRPQPGEVVDDLPQPENRAHQDFLDLFLIGQGNEIGPSVCSLRCAHCQLAPIITAWQCLAIINSSFVGMTHADTRLAERLMRGPPLALASSSSSSPSQLAPTHTAARIGTAFSP